MLSSSLYTGAMIVVKQICFDYNVYGLYVYRGYCRVFKELI